MLHFSMEVHKLLTEYATYEANRAKSHFIEIEHILLAILKKKSLIGHKVLVHCAFDITRLRITLESKLNIKTRGASFNEISRSRNTNQLLYESNKIAEKLKHSYLTTGHIILAMIENPQSFLHVYIGDNNIDMMQLEQVCRLFYNKEIKNKNNGFNTFSNKFSLSNLAYDLTQKVSSSQEPVIGREKEINRLIQVLSRKNKNNPILLGEPGVGKTAIVEGLACAIIEERVPSVLKGKRIFVLDLASLVAGTQLRGQFEAKLKRIITKVSKAKNIILFIDEIHTIIGAGSSQGSLDAANILKPALARGEVHCIGATTLQDYKKYFEKDASLVRRFQQVMIEEPSEHEVFNIISGLKDSYEKYHNVSYSKEALQKIVSLSARYIHDRAFPDKAIDVLDEVGAMKRTENEKMPNELLTIERQIEKLQSDKLKLLEYQDYEKAIILRDEVNELKKTLSTIKNNWENPHNIETLPIDEKDVAKTVAIMTGIPSERMTETDMQRMKILDKILKEKVIGQNEAIDLISSCIRRSRAGISSKDRPIGSFLFLGPTGVGKTLLAKTLSEYLFGSSHNLFRIDMSDYMEKHSVSKLIGSPPGYVGFENGGLITEKVKRNPYCIILLDEIEKAHQDVFNILLQVLEEGELQDSSGYTVSFRNTIIIMTSNAGSRSILKDSIPGFSIGNESLMTYSDIKANALSEIKRFLSPEFINRLDDMVVFAPLNKDSIEKILILELKKLEKRLKEKDLNLSLTKNAISYFVKKGYEPSYGARPMRRLIQTEIEENLAMMIIEEKVLSQSCIVVDVENEKVILKVEKPNEDERIALPSSALVTTNC
ncbi:MAG: ATP-dependent Clp protease ATP-binding subunit [Treponema sp.]